MAGKRYHYYVYHRAVRWWPHKGDPEPETTPEIEDAPWWFVDDVWAKSAERAVEIVQERLRKEPGYPFNLAPDYVYWSSMFLDMACRVDWMCGPEPEDDPEDLSYAEE